MMMMGCNSSMLCRSFQRWEITVWPLMVGTTSHAHINAHEGHERGSGQAGALGQAALPFSVSQKPSITGDLSRLHPQPPTDAARGCIVRHEPHVLPIGQHIDSDARSCRELICAGHVAVLSVCVVVAGSSETPL